MIKIYRNSMIIENVDKDDSKYKQFTNSLSIWNITKYYQKGPRYIIGKMYVEYDGKLYIPSSLGENYVKRYFPNKLIKKMYAIEQLKYRDVAYNIKTTLRPGLQEAGFNYISKVKNDVINKQRLICLRTGVGKTCLSINLAKNLRTVPLIIVHKSELTNQWKEQFLFHTDIVESKICIIKGIKNLDNLDENADVYITTHQTLTSLTKNDIFGIDKLVKRLGIGIRIFDEAHRNTSSMCSINSLSNVEYTLYLTATPSKSKLTEDEMYQKLIGGIPFFDGKFVKLDENVDRIERYVNVINYPFSSKPTDYVKATIRTVNHGFSSAKWCSWLSSGGFEYFKESLIDIFTLLKLKTQGAKTVVIIPELELIDAAKKILDEYFDDINLEVSTLNGSMKTKEREIAKSKQFIIATDKMLGDGSDIEGLQVMINYNQYRSVTTVTQMVGRLRFIRDKQVVYVDITDRGFKECTSMSSDRKKYLESIAKRIVNVKK